MNAKTLVALAAVASLVLIVPGCPANNASYSAHVNQIVVVGITPFLDLKIRGPATDLSIRITRVSDGWTNTKYVSKAWPEDNSIDVSLPMASPKDTQEQAWTGPWFLEMKTHNPERLVLKGPLRVKRKGGGTIWVSQQLARVP